MKHEIAVLRALLLLCLFMASWAAHLLFNAAPNWGLRFLAIAFEVFSCVNAYQHWPRSPRRSTHP